MKRNIDRNVSFYIVGGKLISYGIIIFYFIFQSSKNKKLLKISPKSKKKSSRTKMEMETKNGDPHKKMANGFTSQENHGKLKK